MRLSEQAAALGVDADGKQRAHRSRNIIFEHLWLVRHRDGMQV
jgi:hypothetical protein